ncbi:MAG: NAD-dependent epimerase/dehydratase family protein [Gemmatimonadaceae bacterium]
MRVLVTGGAGFIGSHIVDALAERGDSVVVLDSLDPGVHHAPPTYLRSDVDHCFVDLRWWTPDARFDDIEAIVHLAALGGVGRAAKETANVLTANVGGTARLVDAAARFPKLKAIVLASSFSVYGSNYKYKCGTCGAERNAERSVENLAAGRYEVLCNQCGAEAGILPLDETAQPNPLEPYGASKYMQELCFRGFTAAPVRIMRFSSVYGPRLRLDDGEATIIAKMAGWIASGNRPALFEDGRQIRDWVYVGDVVATTLALLDNPSPPSLVNVCTGVPTTLTEACTLIAEALGVDCPPEIVGGFRPGDMRHCLGDAAVLRTLLGRDPVDLNRGVPLAFQPQGDADGIRPATTR